MHCYTLQEFQNFIVELMLEYKKRWVLAVSSVNLRIQDLTKLTKLHVPKKINIAIISTRKTTDVKTIITDQQYFAKISVLCPFTCIVLVFSTVMFSNK